MEVQLTQRQQEVLEVMALNCHLILADPEPDGAVTLTPARFCERCGGDGFVERDHGGRSKYEPCGACGGRGGIPVLLPARSVTPSGEVRQ